MIPMTISLKVLKLPTPSIMADYILEIFPLALELGKQNMRKSQEKLRLRYDQTKVPSELEVGDLVMYYVPIIRKVHTE
jgi:hypothetical protein